jgi:hypothetical protein
MVQLSKFGHEFSMVVLDEMPLASAISRELRIFTGYEYIVLARTPRWMCIIIINRGTSIVIAQRQNHMENGRDYFIGYLYSV